MRVDDFWKLIDEVDRIALQNGEGYEDKAVEPLIRALTALDKEELQSFQEHLAQALYGLDGRVYYDAAGDIGDDGFLYARCFVVATGREAYNRMLTNPDLMPKGLAHWCEPLLYVASSAWEKRTGETLDFDAKVSFETGSNASLW
jgi:Protein of unknown function (DUF4240)